MSNLLIGQYIPGDSIIHKLDARTKILGLIIFAAAIVSERGVWAYAVVAVALICIIAVSGIKPVLLFQNLKGFVFLLIAVFLVQVFLGQDFKYAVGILLSVLLFLVLALLFTYTTSPLNLMSSLESFFYPLRNTRLPVAEVILALTIAMRFIPIILEEAQTIIDAQRSRGGYFTGKGISGFYRAIIILFVPLLVNVFQRADQLAFAMEARGYVLGVCPTSKPKVPFLARDYAAIFLLGGFLVTVRLFSSL